MTTAYENIPTVLPGSDAASAVDEIGAYYKQHGRDGLEQAVADIAEKHGADPIKASAMRGAAQEMIDQNPDQAEKIAKHLVGTTIADPAIAGQQASNSISQTIKDQGLDYNTLTNEQKTDLAMQAAEKSIADAGGAAMSSDAKAAMRAKMQQQIAQGLTPGQAASAAVVAYMGPQVGSANAVGAFDIFGYVTSLVHGEAVFTFKDTETIHVKQTAMHNYMDNISYLLEGKKYTIYADTIKTSGSVEKARVHSGTAYGHYHGKYVSKTALSVSIFSLMSNIPNAQVLATGGIFSASGVRFYAAVFDKDFIIKGGGGVTKPKDLPPGKKYNKFQGDRRKEPVKITFTDFLIAAASVIRF